MLGHQDDVSAWGRGEDNRNPRQTLGLSVRGHFWLKLAIFTRNLCVTMRRKTNSNDFGGFGNQLADSNSIFAVAKMKIFERFDFLVCSKFNHTPCGRSCACAVACLHPHNSNSNVVVSVTIHENILTKNIF